MVNKRKSPRSKSTQETQGYPYYDRIKIGDIEREVAGHDPEWVERRMNDMLAAVPKWLNPSNGKASKKSEGITQLALPLDDEENVSFEQNTLLWSDSSVNSTPEIVSISVTEPLATDLLSVYLKSDPKSQLDSMMVIALYVRETENKKVLAYEDITQASNVLLEVGFKPFANPRQVVKEAVNRKLMYKPDSKGGQFALTIQGVEYAKELIDR